MPRVVAGVSVDASWPCSTTELHWRDSLAKVLLRAKAVNAAGRDGEVAMFKRHKVASAEVTDGLVASYILIDNLRVRQVDLPGFQALRAERVVKRRMGDSIR